MSAEPLAIEYLKSRGVPFRVFRHINRVHTLEQAAAERNQQPEQVVRSILFRRAEGEYFMVLLNGTRRISWKTLRQHFHQSRLTLADGQEVLSVTGYPTGAVTPLGIPPDIPILIDRAVLIQSEISIGSGERHAALILHSLDLLTALTDPVIGDFSET